VISPKLHERRTGGERMALQQILDLCPRLFRVAEAGKLLAVVGLEGLGVELLRGDRIQALQAVSDVVPDRETGATARTDERVPGPFETGGLARGTAQ
jgi:hypothetical protein